MNFLLIIFLLWNIDFDLLWLFLLILRLMRKEEILDSLLFALLIKLGLDYFNFIVSWLLISQVGDHLREEHFRVKIPHLKHEFLEFSRHSFFIQKHVIHVFVFQKWWTKG